MMAIINGLLFFCADSYFCLILQEVMSYFFLSTYFLLPKLMSIEQEIPGGKVCAFLYIVLFVDTHGTMQKLHVMHSITHLLHAQQ